MDKKLLLTLQWACNIKGVKIPWEIVATEMGPTITAGAVIQHLAKFRQRMVAQGAEVPPALSRGGNNYGPATKASQTSKANTSTKAGSTRRKAKLGRRMPKKDEDSEDDTDEEDFEVDDESEIEASQNEPKKSNTKAKAKGRNSKAAKVKQQADADTSEDIKNEPESSLEPDNSQTRYGVGDDMWPGDAYQRPTRTRTSESTSQSPQSPTKLLVLNIGRAGFAKLGILGNADDSEPKNDSSRQETLASDPYSDHNHQNTHCDYSVAADTSNHRGDTSMHRYIPDDFDMDHDGVLDGGFATGLHPHSSFEDHFVTSSTLYDQDQSHAMSGLECDPGASAYDAREKSTGNRGQVHRVGPNSARSSGIANPDIDDQDSSGQTHRFVHYSYSSPSKPGERAHDAHDHTKPAHRAHRESFDVARIAAHADHPPRLPLHGGLYSTRAPHPGNGGIDCHFPDPEMQSINDSHPESYSHTGSGIHSSYSSADSHHPVGGEFANYHNVGMDSYNESPVAISRTNSGFECLGSHLQPDIGTSWGPFFEQNFEY
ncbi:MAG: hypothetical protein Q9182_001012 [Xanthomendoza sp. 2 TL-2023]